MKCNLGIYFIAGLVVLDVLLWIFLWIDQRHVREFPVVCSVLHIWMGLSDWDKIKIFTVSRRQEWGHRSTTWLQWAMSKRYTN